MKNNEKRDFQPIYIPWYEEAFQADLYVRRMTPRQRALYRNLIMGCYFGGERPYLPLDDEKLWMIADAENKQEWLDNKDTVLTKFTITVKDGSNVLANKRVMEEWQILEGWLAQKQKAGLASAAARRRNGVRNDALAAAQAALKMFSEKSWGDMDADEQTGLQMVLWVLYRAAVAGEVPRTVDYYSQARSNFLEQHEIGWEQILETAEEKFDMHAYAFVEAENPPLLNWLMEKRQIAKGFVQ